MKIRVLNDQVLLKVPPNPEEKIGSIIVPASTRIDNVYMRATVYGVGNGKRNAKTGVRQGIPDFAVGDDVFVARLAGTRLFIDGEAFILTSKEGILGVYNEDEPVV